MCTVSLRQELNTNTPDISDSGFWVETEWPSSKQTSPGTACSGSLRSAGSDRSPGLWSAARGSRSVRMKKTRFSVTLWINADGLKTRSCLDLGFSSGLVTDLRSLGVHVYISLVLHLSPENLRPGFESGLQTHPEDALDLRRKDHRIGSNTALRTHVSLVYDSGGGYQR